MVTENCYLHMENVAFVHKLVSYSKHLCYQRVYKGRIQGSYARMKMGMCVCQSYFSTAIRDSYPCFEPGKSLRRTMINYLEVIR